MRQLVKGIFLTIASAEYNPRTYVARVQAGREHEAKQRLDEQGFVSWFPLCSYLSTVSGKRMRVIKALFPAYVFVEFDIHNERWACVSYTRGVLGLLGSGETPSFIRDREVQHLKALMTTGDGIVSLDERPRHIPAHTMVHVLFGQLHRMTAEVTEDRGNIVETLINFAGAKRKMFIPRSMVEDNASVR